MLSFHYDTRVINFASSTLEWRLEAVLTRLYFGGPPSGVGGMRLLAECVADTRVAVAHERELTDFLAEETVGNSFCCRESETPGYSINNARAVGQFIEEYLMVIPEDDRMHTLQSLIRNIELIRIEYGHEWLSPTLDELRKRYREHLCKELDKSYTQPYMARFKAALQRLFQAEETRGRPLFRIPKQWVAVLRLATDAHLVEDKHYTEFKRLIESLEIELPVKLNANLLGKNYDGVLCKPLEQWPESCQIKDYQLILKTARRLQEFFQDD